MSHSQFSNSIIPGLGPRKQSLRRKFISHNFFGNQNPREVPEGQKGVRKGRTHTRASIIELVTIVYQVKPVSQNTVFQWPLKPLYFRTVRPGVGRGKNWFTISCYHRLKACPQWAWTPLHFKIENAWVPEGFCDVLCLSRGSQDEKWRQKSLTLPGYIHGKSTQ